MSFFFRQLRGVCVPLAVIFLLALSACNNAANPNAAATITVGGTQSTESQLLTTMYALLLRHAGFTVVEHAGLASETDVFGVVVDKKIDLAPAFTGVGLNTLGLESIGNAQQDYLQVKQGYEAKYQIAWLNPAPLNDTYGICTTQAQASRLQVTKISDLKDKAANLTIAASHEGIQYGVDLVKAGYGLNFKQVVTYGQENQTFSAVSAGTQDLNICSATSADIARDKFVQLQDDKNMFPSYNPAPIIRDSRLKKSPQIATILNQLAPHLTTQVGQQLQSKVVDNNQSVTTVATQFLQQQGLLH